jgi:hypothetical protein
VSRGSGRVDRPVRTACVAVCGRSGSSGGTLELDCGFWDERPAAFWGLLPLSISVCRGERGGEHRGVPRSDRAPKRVDDR